MATTSTVDRPDWFDHAACRGMNPDAWHPEQGESTREAVEVCRTCPVATECLTYALEHDIDHGVWGGIAARSRRTIRRDRRRRT